MARLPEFLSIDTLGAMALRSFQAAEAGLLSQASTCQHALMSGFGGPLQCYTTYLDGTSSTDTLLVPVRVPPGITHARIAIAGRGRSHIKVTTPADTFGSFLVAPAFGGTTAIYWVWGSAGFGSELSIQNRLLRLFASPAETWRTVWASASCVAGEVFALALQPIHQAR
jgi:hypothetical protein